MNDRYIIVFALFALMAMSTWHRNQDWQTSRSIWESAASVSPDYARPQLNLAHELVIAGDYAGAAERYRLVLKLVQRGDRTALYQRTYRTAALTNLGLLEAIDGKYELSERYLTLMLTEWPEMPYAHVNRGMARLAMNRCQDAVKDFQAAKADYPECGR